MNRNRRAVAIGLARLAPDFILVVVVPAGVDAQVEHLFFKVFLPPGAVGVTREIEVCTPAVPELIEAGLASGRVAHEATGRLDARIRRMIVEQAGL